MVKMMFKRFIPFIILVALLSCENTDLTEDNTSLELRGRVISTSPRGAYNIPWIETLVASNHIPFNHAIQTGFSLVKVVYWTEDIKGNNIKVSGSIFIPDSSASFHLVSIQHGTEVKRSNVGTGNVFYAFEGILMASQGYYVVYPDYIGLGVSELSHPYILKQPSANAVIDMIRAGRNYADSIGIALADSILLTGYSEGGYVTLAAHRDITLNHSDEFSILASSPMAGPYDVVQTASLLLSNNRYDNPGYLGYILNAYNEAYELYSTDEIFAATFAVVVDSVYDGSLDMGQINSALTKDLDVLFNTSFLNSYRSGSETALNNAFDENSLLDWSTNDKIRFYHGLRDETVFPENMMTAVDALRENGSSQIESHSINGATHYSAFFPAFNHTISWFDSLRQGL
jgi:pimeloyl-ACP methyl ester carboxylesterase